MAHNITPHQTLAVVNVKLAIEEVDGDKIADGLNELFGSEVGEGFIADYAFYNTDKPPLVVASSDPEEGELFVVPKESKENQKESAITACEKSIENGTDTAEAFKTLREQLSRIENGELIYP